jgi:hypothetical protein
VEEVRRDRDVVHVLARQEGIDEARQLVRAFLQP